MATSHSYVQFESIKEVSSQFAEKRPGKILTYAFKHYLKNTQQQYLSAKILENRDVPIIGGFESQKSGLSRENRDGWHSCT